MKFAKIDPPRLFRVGHDDGIELKDCGRIQLEPDEQVTFEIESGVEYDVVRKSWGFYATPSLNGRLQKFGLRAVLVKNPAGKFYLFLVERGKEAEFERYSEVENQRIVCWLDSDEALESVERKLEGR